MAKTLKEQAFEIGYREAEKSGYLITPASSKAIMDFVSEHSKKIGDSIPWFKAFNAGQAKWLEDDAKRTFSYTH